MASGDAMDFRLSVLNPGGRDPEQYFDQPVDPESRAPFIGSPTQVRGLAGVLAVSAEESHTLALTGDGMVWTWGLPGEWLPEYEGFGRRPNERLQAIAGLTNATAIAAGREADLAIEQIYPAPFRPPALN